MPLPPASPPRSLCILRLSAIGDVTHVVPIVRTIQAAWPETAITWVIGRTEHALVGDIPGVEFIIFDKAKRWQAYRELHHAMRGRHFDILLHMQMALRASVASRLIPADVRLGFDRARAKDFQWLFTNARIAPVERQHVLDSLFGFTEKLGLEERMLRWDIPVPEAAHQYAREAIPGKGPVLAISPCSSISHRNWRMDGYAAVARHAIEHHGMTVVLTGGPSTLEREYADGINGQLGGAAIDLVGRTNLKQLMAVLQRSTALVAPDSGPAHMGTAAGIPVIGLYACTNPDRARPYLSEATVVNRYPDAVRLFHGREADQVSWGTRVRDNRAMDLISVEDVTTVLDRIMAATRKPGS